MTEVEAFSFKCSFYVKCIGTARFPHFETTERFKTRNKAKERWNALIHSISKESVERFKKQIEQHLTEPPPIAKIRDA
jgi:hypothetical protein